jgi:hypothetical protein
VRKKPRKRLIRSGPGKRSGLSGCAVRNGQGRRAARRHARQPQAPKPGHEIVAHQEKPAVAKETARLGSENITKDKEVSETAHKEHIEGPDRNMDPGTKDAAISLYRRQ